MESGHLLEQRPGGQRRESSHLLEQRLGGQQNESEEGGMYGKKGGMYGKKGLNANTEGVKGHSGIRKGTSAYPWGAFIGNKGCGRHSGCEAGNGKQWRGGIGVRQEGTK